MFRLLCSLLLLVALRASPALGADCTVDEDCPEGFYCHGVVCVEKVVVEPDCETDDDCPSGRKCVNGKCVAVHEDPECKQDDDCETGYFCSGDGKCIKSHVDDPDCVSDADCLDGQTCDHGVCLGDPAAPDCVTGEDCRETDVCGDGSCTTGSDADLAAQPDGDSDAKGMNIGLDVGSTGDGEKKDSGCSLSGTGTTPLWILLPGLICLFAVRRYRPSVSR